MSRETKCRKGARIWIALAMALCVMAANAICTAGASAASVTQIPAGSGEHGYPYDAAEPLINLGAVGYTEREFLMSGTANTYRENGAWRSNGDWNVAVSQSNVPYTTRLLVRYPTNPEKFNGTVVFEWMNDTTGADQDPVWAQMASQPISEGFAYVGVTAQKAGMEDLKTWDPVRHGRSVTATTASPMKSSPRPPKW
jgi:Alpha/beta hydrolase domain